ncbi:hypothetical protein HNR67_003552 [Crossiella cryophila]|uniref:Uncharacterized protein n=1 Tax=Crossiella cryophila TaxID=43355 RepID=A0A7W7CDB8_9PSEU|nr:hypothetical protein [Crossiella cryophila]
MANLAKSFKAALSRLGKSTFLIGSCYRHASIKRV